MEFSESIENMNIIYADESINSAESSQYKESSEVTTEKKPTPQPKKFIRLPLARVKNIMKLDSECQKVTQDSVFLVTKATELFVELLGRESAKFTQQGKRKTVQRRDVDAVISEIPQLCFLEGALE
ncbi:hypothetical protein FQA39_LY02617 [Lamprigera yunnana]|nr:hypothetical protein FQA39_LY02617 [Lamprigera yunnana]